VAWLQHVRASPAGKQRRRAAALHMAAGAGWLRGGWRTWSQHVQRACTLAVLSASRRNDGARRCSCSAGFQPAFLACGERRANSRVVQRFSTGNEKNQDAALKDAALPLNLRNCKCKDAGRKGSAVRPYRYNGASRVCQADGGHHAKQVCRARCIVPLRINGAAHDSAVLQSKRDSSTACPGASRKTEDGTLRSE
jgi:hypothetical protein